MWLFLSCAATDPGVVEPALEDTQIEQVPGVEPVDEVHPVFREDVVHELVVTLTDEAWAELAADGRTYVPAVFADGEVELDVGLRIKGWSSSQPLTGKPSLKVDFDRFVTGQRWHDLEALDLHAELTDAAALSEWAAYRLFRDQGLPASRTGWAHLELSGLDCGFYTLVEKKDDQLLEVWWDDTSGSLYESSSEAWPCDLDDPGCDCWEADEEGSGDTRDDLVELCEAVTSEDFETVLADVPEFLPFMATEILIGAHDHYAGYSGNVYLYHQPSDGSWTFIPSSMNNQFGSSRSAAPTCSATAYTLADYQHGILASRCQGDPACLEELYVALQASIEHLESSSLIEDMDAVEELITPWVEADPKSPWSADQFHGQIDCIQDWLRARPAQLAAELPEPCLGEGDDLDIVGTGTLSSNQRCDRDTPEAPVWSVLGVSGGSVTLSEVPVGLDVGDEVLFFVMRSADAGQVGQFEFGEVQEIDGATVVLDRSPPAGDVATLQRVPSFEQVHVEGHLTTGAWDGETGGVLAFRADRVTIADGGVIGMSGRGYRGGGTGPSFNTDGFQGESLTGTGLGGGTPGGGYNAATIGGVANLGGGGALICGGGGEHAGGATAAESWNGVADPALPGQVTGDASVEQPLMGSGGGGVAWIYDHLGPGGAGGGVVLIWADDILVEGVGGIAATGETTGSWSRGDYTYGAGGGAGGTIWLAAEELSLAAGALNAEGGLGYSEVERPGGDGGVGRIRVDCEEVNGEVCSADSLSGLAVPDVGY
ncbi:MAG: hypothetical protein GY913_10520 [Proteobacteria bacterium]|nr:hypothetical protein [Pseudomonadota bacterium]